MLIIKNVDGDVDISSMQVKYPLDPGFTDLTSSLTGTNEGQHIAKQHVTEKNLREYVYHGQWWHQQTKETLMEHHIVLYDGTVMSPGFTEIVSDETKSLLELQTIAVPEEFSRIHCTNLSKSGKKDILKKSYDAQCQTGL
ncbi:hypothetical protein PoB_000312800 [Plakobranchus ocellatus]|uniref:Uncharacterized protein n=1 Tax=Plakobranchus ocellatus TaxID=259542 RepID=A0AAV3Y1W0_9GAST|nr:hypothetical protein PoB_000312800 [Plakobranchus ocellatus]